MTVVFQGVAIPGLRCGFSTTTTGRPTIVRTIARTTVGTTFVTTPNSAQRCSGRSLLWEGNNFEQKDKVWLTCRTKCIEHFSGIKKRYLFEMNLSHQRWGDITCLVTADKYKTQGTSGLVII